MVAYIDALHSRARHWVPFQRLAIVSRILLGLAFIPTGLVKLLGHRFTALPPDNPVGYFFEAMYQSGYYWNFIGLGQVSAGLLLLIPATATLGAIAFFPVILNITVVTWSVGFTGTKYITLLMLLAAIFLLCWDWDRFKSILVVPAGRPNVPTTPLVLLERVGYLMGTAAAMGVLLALRSMLPHAVVLPLLGGGAIAACLVLAGWVQLARRPSAS